MYFTIQVTRKNEEYAKAIFGFETLKEAKSNHYYFLASASADEEVDYILAEVIDEYGGIICRELSKEDEE